MATSSSTSEGQIKLATDLLASAMSESVPPNWWGYGMLPEMMVKTPGTSQTADVTGKARMASAPPNPPMNQSSQYTTTTTARPYTGNSQAPTFQMPNASADPMLTQQRFMTQPGYVNPMMIPNYQSTVDGQGSLSFHSYLSRIIRLWGFNKDKSNLGFRIKGWSINR